MQKSTRPILSAFRTASDKSWGGGLGTRLGFALVQKSANYISPKHFLRSLFWFLFVLAGAPRDYGPGHALQCNVSYTDTLVLECPDLTSPFQKNESDTVVTCNVKGPNPQYSSCTLNADRNLTNLDSGLYFCKVLTSGSASSIQLSYVEVNVLGMLFCVLYDFTLIKLVKGFCFIIWDTIGRINYIYGDQDGAITGCSCFCPDWRSYKTS